MALPLLKMMVHLGWLRRMKVFKAFEASVDAFIYPARPIGVPATTSIYRLLIAVRLSTYPRKKVKVTQ